MEGRRHLQLAAAIAAVASLALIGCSSGYSGGSGASGGGSGATSGGDYVARYCKYGAVSRAQLNECEDNVGARYVDSLNTNAALFARRKISTCLADSGPFCQDVVAQDKADYYGSMGG